MTTAKWAGLVTLLVMGAGCAGESTQNLSTGSTNSVAQAVTLPVSGGCSDLRQVGITLFGNPGVLPDQGCPDDTFGVNGAWRRVRMTQFSYPRAPGLADLCAYEWDSAAGMPPEPAALPNDSGRMANQWLQPDCQVVAPMAPVGPKPAPTGIARDLLQQLQTQTSGMIRLETNPISPMTPVRVAVVDTDPDSKLGPLVPGLSQHGYTLARLIQNTTCPPRSDPAECKTRVQQVLGLNYADTDIVDNTNGGHTGTLWNFAAAITRAVDDYVDSYVEFQPGVSAEHLVINLSAGWDPRWGGLEAPDSMPPAALAVRRALIHAQCNGAIVFAAAGNHPGGPIDPGEEGAILPARWETVEGPTAEECEMFEERGYGSVFPHRVDLSERRPLVYAIGSVSGADAVLNNARPLATPRLNAPGGMGAAIVPAGETYLVPGGTVQTVPEDTGTRAMTGSSVSTALASAAASLVWGYQPDAPITKVVETLYRSAVPLSKGPTAKNYTCLEGITCDGPARLSICGAVRQACAGGAGVGNCPDNPQPCEPLSAYEGRVTTISDPNNSDLDQLIKAADFIDGSMSVSANSGPEEIFFGGGALPRVSPQPFDGGCQGICVTILDPSSKIINIYLELQYANIIDLEQSMLVLYSGKGVLERYALSPSPALGKALYYTGIKAGDKVDLSLATSAAFTANAIPQIKGIPVSVTESVAVSFK